MREPKEADVLRDCLSWLKLHGVFCWRQNQGAITGMHNGKRRFFRMTSQAGVSDILGLLPPSGRLLAVECKRGKRQLTLEQGAFLEIVQQCGGVGLCVRSIDDLEQGLIAAGVWPLPEGQAA